MVDSFPLDAVSRAIQLRGFKRVVLQFPDEHLQHCVDVYARLSELVGDAVSLFIAADSTYGSSVDDVSAQHVDGDLLVYFGSDLSGSGAMPVMIAPMRVTVDKTDCAARVSSSLGALDGSCTHALVLFEPGCHHAVVDLMEALRESLPRFALEAASLPPCADMTKWNCRLDEEGPNTYPASASSDVVVLGGLHCRRDHPAFTKVDAPPAPQALVYIGDKAEQLDNILLHLSQCPVLHYSPRNCRLVVLTGCETKVFRQRYLGVQGCASASIIGIIVGSMGLTAASTQHIIRRLQLLIEAAGKRHYTFVMGRLNEAKICNFPEIDLFVLVGNEDLSLVAPKTFERPVITPWELELGLGAREWNSSYQSSPDAWVGGAEQEWERVLQRVRDSRPEGNGLDTDDDDDDDEDGGGVAGCGCEREGKQQSSLVQQASRALTVFHSPAAELLAQRDYQGLVPEVDPAQTTAVQQGLFGVAASYERST